MHGGYKVAPLPPPVTIQGAPLPPSWSLARYIVRIHNQGSSNSCVGQTAATIEEIHSRELAETYPKRLKSHDFSSGFLWNQLNGGQNVGITYDAAFGLQEREGIARLKTFPPDGATGYWMEPGPTALRDAEHFKAASFRSIYPTDRYTMEAEIHAGRPIAIAIAVTDSFYNQFGDTAMPLISSQYGPFHFNHSLTGIGYTPQGLIILNSWGPDWGYHGQAILSWAFIQQASVGIVAVTPLPPHLKAQRKPAGAHRRAKGRTAGHRKARKRHNKGVSPSGNSSLQPAIPQPGNLNPGLPGSLNPAQPAIPQPAPPVTPQPAVLRPVGTGTNGI